MPVQTIPCLRVKAPKDKAAGFAALLQHGILYGMDRPVAMGDFLLSLPGFSRKYLEETVQTIFVNGVAADSFAAPLRAGSTLALSAAMPGLAGAIFRREGVHGFLRSQTAGADSAEAPKTSGYIKLKLFNQVATDRVAQLMAAGILMEAVGFCSFAARREDLFQAPVSIELNREVITYAQMLQRLGHPLLVDVELIAVSGV